MFLLLVLLAVIACDAGKLPNIILFLTDDLGYGTVNHNATWGFPMNTLDPTSKPVVRHPGLETISTPNLARMASQGMRATMSYAASSICAPSRAAIFLERHVGIIDCIRGNAYEATHELPSTTSQGFVKTMQRDAGYVTGYFGKWGLGELRGGPWSVGFDEFAGVLTHREAHVAFPNTVYEFQSTRNAIPTSREQVDLLRVDLGINSLHKWSNSNTANATYFNDYIVDKALQFIQQPRSDKSFLVVVSPTYPHWAIYNTEDTHSRHFAVTKLITPSRATQKPVIMRNYASQIEQHLDRDVGRILDLLQQDSNMDANTLFVFTSDNGGDKLPPIDKTIYKPNGGLLGGKFDMYEGGIRVPTILRWPGVFAAGTVSRTPFVLFDLFPTFREVAGVPPAPTRDANGRPTLALSMLQVWKTGREDTVRSRQVLHFEYCNNVTKRTVPCTMATMDLSGYYSSTVTTPTVYKMVQLKTLKRTRKMYDLNIAPSEKQTIAVKATRQAKQQALTAERSALRTEFNPQNCAL